MHGHISRGEQLKFAAITFIALAAIFAFLAVLADRTLLGDGGLAHPDEGAIRIALITTLGAGFLAAFFCVQVLVGVFTNSSRAEATRLQSLYDAGQYIRSTLESDELLSGVTLRVARFTGSRAAFVVVQESRSEDPILKAAYRAGEEIPRRFSRVVTEWSVLRAVATGEKLQIKESCRRFESLIGLSPPKDQEGIVLLVPMMIRDIGVGVIIALRDAHLGPFNNLHVSYVEELAGQTAIALEQVNLFQRVSDYVDELEDSYENTLKALMAALDARDHGTQGHSERVAELAVALSREMGIPEEKLCDIERGALLHDLGKIGVPDSVLLKRTALNRHDWNLMKQHPLTASIMISDVGFLKHATPILLYHHEHFDGTGYPFGLSGENIPIEARIFAVVDAYDAMTSNRPYRDAIPHEKAMTEIRDQSGKQFDPEVVEAFERLAAAAGASEETDAA